MKVICISGKARHGKDTVAEMLKEEIEQSAKTAPDSLKAPSVLIFHYADLLKFICKKCFHWNGEKDEPGRALLQYVGTDVVREQNPDYWVDFVVSLLHLFPDKWDIVILPDCRFPNEIEKMKQAGYDVTHVHVVRPELLSKTHQSKTAAHISENAMQGVTPDVLISNNGTLNDLQKSIHRNYLTILSAKKYLNDLSKEQKRMYATLASVSKASSPQTIKSKPFTVLVDVDNVLIDTLSSWIFYLNTVYHKFVFPKDITKWDISKFYPDLTKEQIFEPLTLPQFWEMVKPIPKASEYLQAFLQDDYQVFLCTASFPQSMSAKANILQKWFPFIPWENVIVCDRKQQILGDVLIDDNPGNLLGGRYTGILMDAPYNRNVSNITYRAKDWDQINECVRALYTAKQAQKDRSEK